MVVRVTNPPLPAAGTDWRYTIPGQYLVNLMSVASVMVDADHPTSFADATGNGHDATATGYPTFSFGGGASPYGGSTSPACDGNLQAGGHAKVATSAASAAFNPSSGPISVTGWCYVASAPQHGNMGMFGVTNPPGINGQWQFVCTNTAIATYTISLKESLAIKHTFAATITTNVWHHIAVTWDGATWTLYVDAISVATHAGDTPSNGGGFFVLYGEDTGTAAFPGFQSSVGCWNFALSGAQVATLAGTSGSSAAYKAAALAMSPVALWMMDEPAPVGARTVALEITNGTNTVLTVPGTTVVGTAPATTWTWSADAHGTNVAQDGSTALIQIPHVMLPAGYTIGTRTLDMHATDQWTSIAIQFDDGTGDPIGGGRYPVPFYDLLLLG